MPAAVTLSMPERTARAAPTAARSGRTAAARRPPRRTGTTAAARVGRRQPEDVPDGRGTGMNAAKDTPLAANTTATAVRARKTATSGGASCVSLRTSASSNRFDPYANPRRRPRSTAGRPGIASSVVSAADREPAVVRERAAVSPSAASLAFAGGPRVTASNRARVTGRSRSRVGYTGPDPDAAWLRREPPRRIRRVPRGTRSSTDPRPGGRVRCWTGIDEVLSTSTVVRMCWWPAPGAGHQGRRRSPGTRRSASASCRWPAR